MKKKPYSFWPEVGKPFKCPIKKGSINGYRIGKKKTFTLSHYVPVTDKDAVRIIPDKGVEVNGVLIPRKCKPWICKKAIINYVARRIRIAVYPEEGGWIAADITSYHVDQGDTPIQAIKHLVELLKFTEWCAEKDRKDGLTVIRNRLHRRKDCQKDLRDMERRAKKKGIVLDGVDWRKTV